MSKRKIQKMDEKKFTTSTSVPTFEREFSLLEEINQQAQAELTPKLNQRKLEGLFISSQASPPLSTKDSWSPTESDGPSSIQSEPNLEVTLIDNLQFANSEPSGSLPFSDEHAPLSSHLGILLLSNARRKLELEEERLEFEKEKKREKEKRKGKKLFFKLSKRIKERTSTMPSVLPASVSDGALRKIEEDENSAVYSTSFDKRNTSTDSGLIPSSAEERDENIEEKVKRLEKEVKDARRHVIEADAECDKLKKTQRSMDYEVHDLTEKLFHEAYKLANAAELRREHAEKLLNEALMKVDLLQAEVKALKEIVKSPNKRFLRDKTSKVNSLLTPKASKLLKSGSSQSPEALVDDGEYREIDPVTFEEFTEWRLSVKKEHCKFIDRLLREDVEPCLAFANRDLSSEVLDAIRKNTLEMEPHFDSDTLRDCALSKIERPCPYRLKTNLDNDWVFISLFSRNRITAVCDIFTYLRYLETGIVTASDEDAFLAITAMRKNLALARFGFHFTAKMNGSGLTDKD